MYLRQTMVRIIKAEAMRVRLRGMMGAGCKLKVIGALHLRSALLKEHFV